MRVEIATADRTSRLSTCEMCDFSARRGGGGVVMSRRLKENQTNNTVLRTEITFQVLNKYVVAVIIRMETYKNIE